MVCWSKYRSYAFPIPIFVGRCQCFRVDAFTAVSGKMPALYAAATDGRNDFGKAAPARSAGWPQPPPAKIKCGFREQNKSRTIF